MVWPLMKELPAPSPGVPVPEQTVKTLKAVFTGARFEKRIARLEALVREIEQDPDALWSPRIDRKRLPSINPALIDILELAAPTGDSEGNRSEEPVIVAKGVLRVTTRFQGIDTESRNKLSEGRLSIARMLGMNEHARNAHLALFELSRTVCTPENPKCEECPLKRKCHRFGVRDTEQAELF